MHIKTKVSTHFYDLLKIGVLANAFEWYEFTIFNSLSLTIVSLFFKSDQPMIGLLKVFTLFAVTHFIRPIGSVAFGVVGDRLGRRYALNLSLMLMTVPTAMIGLLPTYEQAGVLATISLVILRLLQGFAMGGELPATACYVFEAAESHHKPFLCSAVATAPKIGLLWGSFTIYLLMQLTDDQMLLDWGWRIPFLLGIPITLFIAYVRRTVQETTEFKTMQKKAPADSVWKQLQLHQMLKPLRQGLVVCSFFNVGYPILTTYMPFYLHHGLDLPFKTAQLVHLLVLTLMVPLCLCTGYLSQRFGYRKLLVSSMIVTILLIVPIFKGFQLSKHHLGQLLALQAVFACLVSVSQGLFFEMANRLFKPEHRSLGVSLVSTLPASLIAGTIPLVCSTVIYKTGWLLFPAMYIVLSGFIALPATMQLDDSTQTE